MLLYLDHNTAIDVMRNRNPSLAQAAMLFRNSGAKVVYSPAHMEEIANIYRTTISDEDCDLHIPEHLEFFASLTDCWEFLPPDSNLDSVKGRLVQEHPSICFQRVIDLYELTYVAEETEATLRDYIPQNISVLTPDDAFENEEVRRVFRERLFLRGHGEELPFGSALRDSYNKARDIIDICFRSLHDAGFGLEKKTKTRSSIHDVTHAIYGTMADIFVSGDARMLGKVKATYKMLKAECIPMNPDEFITYVTHNAKNAQPVDRA